MTADPGDFLFGPFRLQPLQRRLTADGRPVELGSRAMDILLLLLEQPGALVGKETLLTQVWPGVTVEEGNLRVQMATLRRALADPPGQQAAAAGYIATVPGRGYRFVAPVRRLAAPPPAPAEASPLPAPPPRPMLPAAPPWGLTRIFGRDAVVGELLHSLRQARLVSLVGAGGIGKTTVATQLLAAHAAQGGAPGCFVDFASLTDPALVPSSLATALGLVPRSGQPEAGLVEHLRGQPDRLLVLDGCEHLLAAIAGLVETILRGAPGVRVLVTSQEPLQAEGELVLRLPPLALPRESPALTAAEALQSPAVQLFVERAAARLGQYRLSDAEAPLVAGICRRLDGIALAIELAAGRVDGFGIQGVHQLLDDRFRLLVVGRRTAMPRHQTLRATLAWSFDLLELEDRAVLCRLAIFAGPFTLDAASAILASEQMSRWRVIEAIGNLVAKSLISAELRQGPVHYRLLDSTRIFALEMLRAEDGLAGLARRHAEHFRDRMQQAEAEWESSPPEAWLTQYGRDIDNVRAAHDWAFSPGGDAAIGLALTAAGAALWFQLSLVDEGRARFETALRHLDAGGGEDAPRDIRVLAALGAALLYTVGPGPETDRVWQRAQDLAAQTEEVSFRLRALWGLWVAQLSGARFRPSLETAETFSALAAGQAEPSHRLTGQRLTGLSRIYLGELAAARAALDAVLDQQAQASHVVRLPFNQQLTARAYRTQLLWLQGLPDQALRAAEQTVEEARALGQALSLALTLAEAGCPVPLQAGALPMLERHVALMLEVSGKYSFGPWAAWALCFRGGLAAARGEAAEAVAQLREGLERLRLCRWQIRRTPFLGVLAEALDSLGEAGPARQALAEALHQAEATEEWWCMPELLRIGAEQAWRDGDAAAAEAGLRRALAMAGAQGSLSWRLRSAHSLAQLRQRQGRGAEARPLLAEALGDFTEGFATRDLVAARATLDSLVD